MAEFNAAAAPISPDTEYISSGTYGLTLRPGLPNKKANGTWEQYPNSVTKLFFSEQSLLNAKKSANIVYGYTKNNSHKTNLYRHTYKKKNIPANILMKIPEKKRTLLKNNLYTMRMPDLGIDLSTLYHPDKYRPLRKIKPISLLHQIHRMLEQVNLFVANNKIHADIRDPNMLINPKTGTISIIDFDFFMDATNYFRKYNDAFYNRPIENYIYDFYINGDTKNEPFKITPGRAALVVTRATSSPENFVKIITSVDDTLAYKAKELKTRTFDLNLYMNDQNSQLLFRQDLDLKFKNRDDLIEAMRKNIIHIYGDKAKPDTITEAMKVQYEKAMLPTFDSYGLAIALLDLLVATYSMFAFHPKYSMHSAVSNMFKSKRFEKRKPVEKAAGGAGAKEITFEDYTRDELEYIYKLMQCVFYLVLIPMISLEISTRLTPKDAIVILEEIIAASESPDALNALYEKAVSQTISGLSNTIGREYVVNAKVVAKAAAGAGKSPAKASPKGAAAGAGKSPAKASPKGTAAGAGKSPAKASAKSASPNLSNNNRVVDIDEDIRVIQVESDEELKNGEVYFFDYDGAWYKGTLEGYGVDSKKRPYYSFESSQIYKITDYETQEGEWEDMEGFFTTNIRPYVIYEEKEGGRRKTRKHKLHKRKTMKLKRRKAKKTYKKSSRK